MSTTRVGGPHHSARTWQRSQWRSRIQLRLTRKPRACTSYCPRNTQPSWCLMKVGCLNLMCPPCGPSSKSKRRCGTHWQCAQGCARQWLGHVKLCP